ncbi:flagellar filament capping protein FliD [Oceanisphaera psychrotolerans]|uniref:Flagellar hook-associated protein 2 n=1 Tax=Oceanisphaera psychrotolerans TaxID=1414654 RepID=A0A1J4QCA7_9GAMM|nr:flagellar filament capping protein FliD [Oceanisphaera psychrotolerans]OIN07720.1 flagellar hook-associated protein 2 [Oceanisphaera psychrotolerans]
MATLKLPGVGSGFDIQSFVDITVQAERTPKEQQLARQANSIEVQLSAYGGLKSVLEEFKTSLQKLGDEEAFQKRSASLSESGFVTATADKNAVAGSYTLQVGQLAQAHKLASGAVATDKQLGSGSLTLGVGDESFTVNITKGKSSLAEVAAAINNAEDNKGVRATVITDDGGSRLVYFADNTGTDSQITVSASSNNDGEDGNSLAALGTTTELQAAKNAVITIDGATVTSQSNEIKDAIAGVTLNVKKINDAAGDKPTTTLTIGYDKSAVETNLKSFVTSFNKVISTIKQLSAYDAETESSGPLSGDSSTRNLTSKIRQLLSESVEGAVAPVKSLTALGITTKQDGTIELDDDLLKKQVADNFAKVGLLFSSENGVSTKLDSLMEDYVGTEGILTSKNESLNAQMKKLQDEADAFTEYMTSYEERIYKQFSAMDILIAQMNQQLSSVISAFENMPTFGSSSS